MEKLNATQAIPPKVDEALTSSDSDVREGADIALRCVASGHPPPTITWRREDGQNISLGKYKVSSVDGAVLNVTKASRLHMGAYLCIASNGILPAVSKRIVLSVNCKSSLSWTKPTLKHSLILNRFATRHYVTLSCLRGAPANTVLLNT
ncbi:hypothetical protein LAZ67_9003846 [Cordylochernes scorpioides]|uniref:Ig-like domain-containing protein n=1 Tax=Cordylochernes scorpioides TaxID=51811 RepID=A0ABY6KUN3_9ARAC|nr:hypothetical protein LAZ67_9003846 [Cordylochernes scorpioides]